MPMHELDDAQERYELRALLEIARRLVARPKTEAGRWVGEAVMTLYGTAEADRQAGTTVRTSTLARAAGRFARRLAGRAARTPAPPPLAAATPGPTRSLLTCRLAAVLIARGPQTSAALAAAVEADPSAVCRLLKTQADWFRKAGGYGGRWDVHPAAKAYLSASPALTPAEPAHEPACA